MHLGGNSGTERWEYKSSGTQSLSFHHPNRVTSRRDHTQTLRKDISPTHPTNLYPHRQPHHTMAPSLLFTGLPWAHPRVLDVDRGDHDKIRTGLEKAEKDLLSAGYDSTCFFHAYEDGVSPWVDILKSKKWDGVIIGFGVKGNPELNEFFEGLVNAVREYAPQAKIGFNTSPDSTVAAAKRICPV